MKTSELIIALENGKTLRKDLRISSPNRYSDPDDYIHIKREEDYPWRISVSGWVTDPSIGHITWSQAFYSLWTEKDFWEII